MKLHDRFIGQHGRKAAEYVECTDSMHVARFRTRSIGGLFYVSDHAL
jgi:hypothetical protein